MLWIHPRHAKERACRFLQSGGCKFTDAECASSHGVTVPLSMIKPAGESLNNYVSGFKVGEVMLSEIMHLSHGILFHVTSYVYSAYIYIYIYIYK